MYGLEDLPSKQLGERLQLRISLVSSLFKVPVSAVVKLAFSIVVIGTRH